MRRKMAERRVREEAQQKEALRRRVVALARQEAESLANPTAIAADMDGQKRYLAYLGTLRSDERYSLARSQLQMRWFEATPDEKEEREAAWQNRRLEHRLQHGARQATLTVRARAAAPFFPPARRAPRCVRVDASPALILRCALLCFSHTPHRTACGVLFIVGATRRRTTRCGRRRFCSRVTCGCTMRTRDTVPSLRSACSRLQPTRTSTIRSRRVSPRLRLASAPPEQTYITERTEGACAVGSRSDKI